MSLPLLADAAMFLADFGEVVTYLPRPGSARRTIVAIVDRQPPAELLEAPGMETPPIHIIVANDATAGILATEVDCGGDRVEVPVRVGGAAVEKGIARMVSQDAGFLRLEVH